MHGRTRPDSAPEAPEGDPVRVLLTGGAGFIGSHVTEALLAGGHEVVVVDDLSSGKRSRVPEGVRFVQADIRSDEASRLLREGGFEAVVHHAAQIDVRRSVRDPRADAEINLLGLLNLLEAAAAGGVRRFVFASSGGACYGEQQFHPAGEDHPTRPVSPYGVAKAAGELYLTYYALSKGLSTCALRYANVYGPRQEPQGEGGVVAVFTERCLRGIPCAIYGDGRQTRDYVYVGDVARANRLALEGSFVGAVNIGTGRETCLLDLHRTIAKLAGCALPPSFQEGKAGETRRSCVDPRLAAKVLGWRPEVSLEEGLARTASWFRSLQAA